MQPSSKIKVIVGLGNPGSRYLGTRHNFGFALLDWLLEKGWGDPEIRTTASWHSKSELETAEIEVLGTKIWLLKPISFMNLSGVPLQRFLDFHKLSAANIVVAHDEVDLPLASLKIKEGGGHGGHNGLRSINECLASSAYLRIRLGVGRPPNPEWDLADWVLARFNKDEIQIVEQTLDRATLALKELILNGVKFAQNRFNC